MLTQSHAPKNSSPWLMLLIRLLLFGLFQALFALFFFLIGMANSWNEAAKWWPVSVVLTNLICIYLLSRLYQKEGLNFRDIYRFGKETVKSDIVALLLASLILGPIGFFPNLLLSRRLFGDSLIALAMYIQPLPLWATLVAATLFPLTQGLAELPTYFAYAMPRLETQTGKRWMAIGSAAFFLGIQHVLAPFILDYRFILWRALMFLPFALATGILMRWCPRLMPYMVILHILMDLSLAPYFLGA